MAQGILILAPLLLTIAAGCSAPPAASSEEAQSTRAAATPCKPLETRSANASEQRPTFPNQTRACGVTSNVAFDVTVVAKGLDSPWAVEPLPNGDFLITE